MVPILYQRKGLVCNHKYGRWVTEIAMKQMPEKRKWINKKLHELFLF
jgi:hypothetical protein